MVALAFIDQTVWMLATMLDDPEAPSTKIPTTSMVIRASSHLMLLLGVLLVRELLILVIRAIHQDIILMAAWAIIQSCVTIPKKAATELPRHLVLVLHLDVIGGLLLLALNHLQSLLLRIILT
jgi:hypothetical protein